MSKISILIVDDHEVVRIGLRSLLGRYPNLDVVGEAGKAGDAVEMALRLRPDIVLLDIRLPDGNGIDVCAEISSRSPNTKVIMLTSFGEDGLLFDAIAAGASGYVLKQVGSESLVTAIEAVGRGESLLDPTLTGRVFARLRQSVARERRDAFADLNGHEVKILALLTKGMSNKEIGLCLSLCEKTVRNYVSHILGKLSLASRAEAAAFAVKHHVELFAG